MILLAIIALIMLAYLSGVLYWYGFLIGYWHRKPLAYKKTAAFKTALLWFTQMEIYLKITNKIA